MLESAVYTTAPSQRIQVTIVAKNMLERIEYFIINFNLLGAPIERMAIEDIDKPSIDKIKRVHLNVNSPITIKNWQNKLIERSKELILRDRVFQAITNNSAKTIFNLI